MSVPWWELMGKAHIGTWNFCPSYECQKCDCSVPWPGRTSKAKGVWRLWASHQQARVSLALLPTDVLGSCCMSLMEWKTMGAGDEVRLPWLNQWREISERKPEELQGRHSFQQVQLRLWCRYNISKGRTKLPLDFRWKVLEGWSLELTARGKIYERICSTYLVPKTYVFYSCGKIVLRGIIPSHPRGAAGKESVAFRA